MRKARRTSRRAFQIHTLNRRSRPGAQADRVHHRLVAGGFGGALARAPYAQFFSSDFHALVHDIGGSPRLRALVVALSGLVPGNFFATIPGAADVAREGFAKIVGAIRAGDADEAARLTNEMHRAHGQRVVAHLREKGLFG